jgi:hypothetical protein
MQEAIQAEDMPPLDVDAANVFSKTERIIQEHVRQHDINATVVKDLIQKVIHHRDFNANEVDHDMHQRLMLAVEDGDIEVIDMWEEGDGIQDVSFVKRKVAKVLMELLSDERMAGRQHFGFKLSTNADGDRVLGGDANGSVSFELCIPPKRGLEWTVGELNAILESNLVPNHNGKGQLRTFCCIQWECELYSGRPKARCYPFNLSGHRFRGKNRQVFHIK